MAIDLTRLLTELRQQRDTLLDAIGALERLAGARRRAGHPRGDRRAGKDDAVFAFKAVHDPDDTGRRRK
jgi:hypothetical protein